MFIRRVRSHFTAAVLVAALLFGAAVHVVSGSSPEHWIELRSPNFLVFTNASEKQARHVAYQFEMIRAVFRLFFNAQSSVKEQPVSIIAAKDEATLKVLLPEHWAARGLSHPAGVYVRGPEKNYVALRLDVSMDQRVHEPFEPVYHEYVHYLTRRLMSRLPLWLVEGLAEFYGNTRLESDRVLVGAPSASNLQLLRRNPPLPLSTLFRVDATSPYYNEQNKTSIFYAESWALTHYLITRDWRERTDRLNRFVALLGKDVTPEVASRQTIGDPEQLQKALDAYLLRFAFTAARIDAPTKVNEKDFELVDLTEAESLTVRADFMAHDRHYAEAREMLGKALKLAPKLAAAHESMGFVCTEQGELEEADDWYTQAVALNSQSYLAHYYYAVNLLQGRMDHEATTKAESSLREAIKINPGFAPAYDALGWLLASRPGSAQKPEELEEAHRMALMALELDRGNVHYWLNSAQGLERMGRVDDAIKVATRAADMAKTPDERAEAQTVLANAQQYRDFRKQMQEQQDTEGTPATPPAEAAGSSSPAKPTSSPAKPTSSEEHSPRPTVLPERRVAQGTIVRSNCPAPSTLELILNSSAGIVVVYSDSYKKVPIRALKYGPQGVVNPCVDMNGWSARITYHPAEGQANQGELVAVDLGTN